MRVQPAMCSPYQDCWVIKFHKLFLSLVLTHETLGCGRQAFEQKSQEQQAQGLRIENAFWRLVNGMSKPSENKWLDQRIQKANHNILNSF